MNYPVIFDRFETVFTGLGLAVLEKASNVKVREQINGEYLLSFVLPRTDSKWQYLQSDNIILVDGQLFRIRTFDEVRDSQGKLVSNLQAEHVYYDANDCKHIPNMELIGQTPLYILQQAFAGTRFTVGTVEITTLTDIFLSKVPPSAVVSKLIENVGGELVRDNWTIHLVQKRGVTQGVQFRIGKNLQTVKKSTDATNVVTELYPYGKDSLQINSVNGGLAYIRSPLYDSRLPRVGHKDYKDIEDPVELLTEAQKQWSTADKDGIDKPRVTYQVEVHELKKLAEYGSLEAFDIGDIIKIIDEGMAVSTNQRILEYERFPYEPQKSRIGLANHDPMIYRQNTFPGLINGLTGAKDQFNRMLTGQGDINAQYIENIKAKLQTEINAIVKKALIHDYVDMYVDNLDNPQKAILIGMGTFAIANSKKENGDWNWRTVANGDRIVADEVDALWIYAGAISADQISGGTISGVTINVATDASIGENLYLGNVVGNVHKGIYFYKDGTPGSITVEGGTLGITITSRRDISLYPAAGYIVTVNGSEVATKLWVMSGFADKDHSHNYATQSDISAAIDDHVAAMHT